jgi:paraquat-inducible protein A
VPHARHPTLIACRDCAAIQRLPPLTRGRLECRQCGRVLEARTGRSIDGALACSIATLLLLFPANFLPLMTVHIGAIGSTSRLASGLSIAWREGWPLVSIVLALEGILLPFLRFGMLAATLTILRGGCRGRWVGTMFRWSEELDRWAMADVLLIGAGIGYGRIAAQEPVTIDAGGWCFVVVAFMTMITRGSLERREVWRRIGEPPGHAGPDAVACTRCDLLLPPQADGARCPRCSAPVARRWHDSVARCFALVIATAVLTPLAYGFPMSAFWKAGQAESNTVLSGIQKLFTHGFWYFGVVIFIVSVVFPLLKLTSLSWCMVSIWRRSGTRLRAKTKLYRLVDEVGRWSTLDPFTVLVFTPMIQFGAVAHFDFMGGAAAFLATVALSMRAAHVLDLRLMWDAAADPAPDHAGEPVPTRA